jgi:hypothetical protein
MGMGEWKESPDGNTSLTMAYGGNLILRTSRHQIDGSSCPVWESGTDGFVQRAHMQRDGNFVLSDLDGRPVWSTDTAGNPGAFLSVEDDGEVVIVAADGRRLWTSARSRPSAAPWDFWVRFGCLVF